MIIIIILILILIIYLTLYFYSQSQNSDYDEDESELSGFIDTEYIEPVIYNNFLTREEAEYILQNAKNNFETSRLVVTGNSLDIDETKRNSKTAWIDRNDPIVKNIILRVCKIVNEPFENTENLQVVKYDKNGFYKEHYDSEWENCIEHIKTYGSKRKITMLIYLNDDFKDGGTHFPNLNKTFKPSKCSGVLFYNLGKNSRKCHIKALHAGLPVSSGEKYICNVWIREKTFIV